MESVTSVQFLDEAASTSLSTNAPEKGTNPIILLPVRLVSLVLVRQPMYKKENSEIKPALLHLKLTLYHFLSMMEGLGKCYWLTLT